MQTSSPHLLDRLTSDAVSGAAANYTFRQRCQAELDRCRRYRRDLSVLSIHLDQFHQLAVSYGSSACDATLKAVGEAMLQNLRGTDILGRRGSSDFLVVSPETGTVGATSLAERLSLDIAALSIDHPLGAFSVTASIGCVSVPEDADAIDSATMMAEQLLDQARRAGGNRILASRRSAGVA